MTAPNHADYPVLTSDELEDFRSEIAQYRVKAKICEKKSKKAKSELARIALVRESKRFNDEFEQGCNLYGREQRRSICRGAPRDLPLEIRYQIYEYLVEPAVVSLVAHSEISNRNQGLSRRPQACPFSPAFSLYSFDLIWGGELSHIWECNEVGHLFLTELVKTWYRIHTFRVMDMSLVPEFTISDRWQLGIVPRDHIKHVEVFFNQTDAAKDPYGDQPTNQVQALRSNLLHLGQFNEDTNITMFITSKKCACKQGPHHRCNILEQGDVEGLEFVADMEYAIFDVLRELNDAKLIIVCSIDHALDLRIAETRDIDYEAWCSSILEKQEQMHKLITHSKE